MEGRKTLSVPVKGLMVLGLCFAATGAAWGHRWTDETLSHDGLLRTYSLFAPEELPSQPVALVVTLHGGEMDAFSANNHYDTKWMELAVLNNFIVVFPEGRPDPSGDGGHHWNDCRGEMPDLEAVSHADDVGFIAALIDELSARYPIDPNRVYVNGYSNGGLLTFRLADQLRGRFAAAAAAIASMPQDSECGDTAEPIPMLLINGNADTFVPFEGGAIGDGAGRGSVIPTWDTVRYWLAVNGIDGSPKLRLLPDVAPDDGSRVTLYSYTGGLDGSEVLFYLVDGGGHAIPGPTALDEANAEKYGVKNRDITGAYEMWNFFSRHTLARTPGNGAPRAVADGPLTAVKDGGYALFDVLANDTDPEGDALRVVGLTQAKNGQAMIFEDGAKAGYQPAPGFEGVDSFEYRVSDGRGNIGIATVTVQVRKNAAPVAQDLQLTASDGHPVSFTLAGTDADGDPLTIKLAGVPRHGLLDGAVPNLTYYPQPGFAGTDSFDFVVMDSLNALDTGTVTVAVTPNRPPQPNNLTLTSVKGQGVPFTLSATDPENDAVTLGFKTLPKKGLLDGKMPSFTYYPGVGFGGTDSFEFVACDEHGLLATGTVTIQVVPNGVPVAQDLSVTATPGAPLALRLSATDPDGDPLTYAVTGMPAHGVLLGQSPNLTYYAQAGYAGADTIVFKVWDAFGGVDTGTVNITVVAPPPLVLQASTVRVEKKDAVELAWNGALGTSVRVYRNGVLVATPDNTGSYRDVVGRRGTFKYKVLDLGTGRVSNEATVQF